MANKTNKQRGSIKWLRKASCVNSACWTLSCLSDHHLAVCNISRYSSGMVVDKQQSQALNIQKLLVEKRAGELAKQQE